MPAVPALEMRAPAARAFLPGCGGAGYVSAGVAGWMTGHDADGRLEDCAAGMAEGGLLICGRSPNVTGLPPAGKGWRMCEARMSARDACGRDAAALAAR